MHANALKLGKEIKEVELDSEENLTLIPESFTEVLKNSAKKG